MHRILLLLGDIRCRGDVEKCLSMGENSFFIFRCLDMVVIVVVMIMLDLNGYVALCLYLSMFMSMGLCMRRCSIRQCGKL